MKYGPDISRLAALIGDPARANMLTAMMTGVALTASELANEAGVTKQTASTHLAKLLDAEFVALEKTGSPPLLPLGRCRYRPTSRTTHGACGEAQRDTHQTGPQGTGPEARARPVTIIWLATSASSSMTRWWPRGRLKDLDGAPELSDSGRAFMGAFGIDLQNLERKRRPLCRTCLDWSARRSHLAGALGAALLARIEDLGWARRVPNSRIIDFSRKGERSLQETFAMSAEPSR